MLAISLSIYNFLYCMVRMHTHCLLLLTGYPTFIMNMNITTDEYPPFSLEKPRYNQVSCYIILAQFQLALGHLQSPEIVTVRCYAERGYATVYCPSVRDVEVP